MILIQMCGRRLWKPCKRLIRQNCNPLNDVTSVKACVCPLFSGREDRQHRDNRLRSLTRPYSFAFPAHDVPDGQGEEQPDLDQQVAKPAKPECKSSNQPQCHAGQSEWSTGTVLEFTEPIVEYRATDNHKDGSIRHIRRGFSAHCHVLCLTCNNHLFTDQYGMHDFGTSFREPQGMLHQLRAKRRAGGPRWKRRTVDHPANPATG